MWIAVIPAVLAVLVICLLVGEPEQKRAATARTFGLGKS